MNYFLSPVARIRASLLILLFASTGVIAQTNTFPATGNVGIGTTSPNSKLTVLGDMAAFNPNNSTAFVLLGWLNDVARFRVGGDGSGASNGVDIQGVGNQSLIRILGSGNVGIGTTTPAEKLAVNGNIRAKEVKVETANWPDYVFANDYLLPDLQETEAFIRENKHLPGMPSAAAVERDGISLGEMNRKLLEKVEELTLYIIEKDEKINTQQKQIDSIYQRIDKLENYLIKKVSLINLLKNGTVFV